MLVFILHCVKASLMSQTTLLFQMHSVICHQVLVHCVLQLHPPHGTSTMGKLVFARNLNTMVSILSKQLQCGQVFLN